MNTCNLNLIEDIIKKYNINDIDDLIDQLNKEYIYYSNHNYRLYFLVYFSLNYYHFILYGIFVIT